MLFDLQGRRKTGVKAIYLALAILMGGGLVLFGIGSNVQGGFADIFGNTAGDGQFEKAVEQSAKRVAANPKDPKAYEQLIADRYSWAGTGYDQKTQKFDEDADKQLSYLVKDWEKYVKLTDKPDLNTATYAVQAYIGKSKQDLEGATEAQTLVARLQPNAANYLYLMRLALSTGKSLIADASEIKALELATKDQLKEVRSEIKELRKLAEKQSKDIQRQIQEQFAQQQSQQGGVNQIGSPFGPGGPNGGAPAPAK